MKQVFYILAIALPALIAADELAPSPGQTAKNRQNSSMSKKNPVTVSQNNYGGRVLVLSNGDTYEIHKKDIDRSGGWINGKITVEKQSDYKRDGDKYYRYKLYNDATNDSVWARPLVEENNE